MAIGKIVRFALPLVTYICAAAVGGGFAAYQESKKRKRLQAAAAFGMGTDVGAEKSVALDNLRLEESTMPTPRAKDGRVSAVES